MLFTPSLMCLMVASNCGMCVSSLRPARHAPVQARQRRLAEGRLRKTSAINRQAIKWLTKNAANHGTCSTAFLRCALRVGFGTPNVRARWTSPCRRSNMPRRPSRTASCWNAGRNWRRSPWPTAPTARSTPPASNAVLICHALTGDQYVAELHPLTGKPGWWDSIVGPGLPIDTNRFFVICSNVLGGCMGSTGPASVRADGEIWGTRFSAHYRRRHGSRASRNWWRV